MKSGFWENWKKRAFSLKKEVYALYLVCKDPGTPWLAKTLAALVAAYALCPIDLIPDFIPVLGYLDDLILIPLGIMLVVKLTPPDILHECRQRARQTLELGNVKTWIPAAGVILVWISLPIVSIYLLKRLI